MESAASGIAQSFLAQRFDDRRLERLRLVFRLGGEAGQLYGKSADVDAVADSVALVGAVSALQKLGDVIQNPVLGEWQILAQDVVLLVALGKVDPNLRLQARVNVLGQLECGGV